MRKFLQESFTMTKRLLRRGFLPLLSGVAVLLTGAVPALAGMPIPAPLAGLSGPYGLLAAGAVYGGFRLVGYLRNRA
jgi:hypothetical protein